VCARNEIRSSTARWLPALGRDYRADLQLWVGHNYCGSSNHDLADRTAGQTVRLVVNLIGTLSQAAA